MYDNSCLNTVIKNTSGAPLSCSFIPPHGRTLDAGEEVEITGNILEAIRAMHPTGADRLFKSFKAALDEGLLTIVSTPAPVLEDAVTGYNKVLALANGSLTAVRPCWEESLSEA